MRHRMFQKYPMSCLAPKVATATFHTAFYLQMWLNAKSRPDIGLLFINGILLHFRAVIKTARYTKGNRC